MPFFAPSITDERTGLAEFLKQQCAQLRSSAHGLTTEQAAASPLTSELSISGLLIHSAQVVQGWLTTGMRMPEATPFEMFPEISARIGIKGSFSGAEVPQMSLEEILEIFDRAVAVIDEADGAVDYDAVLPGPLPSYMPQDFVITGRWIWLHLITEIARHAGHADIIREQLDGAISYKLNHLVDGGTEEEWEAEVAAWS